MNGFRIGDLKDHIYHDATITEFSSFGFKGEFNEDETKRSGLVGFSFYFEPFIQKFLPPKLYECRFCDILTFDITPCEKGYDIKLCIDGVFEDMKKEFFCIETHCDRIDCSLYKYFGMSYKNIYNENDINAYEKYINDEYFKEEKEYTLCEGYSLTAKKYAYEEYNKNNRLTVCCSFGKYILKKGDEAVYEFICRDDHFGGRGFSIFEHRNGHRYFWFHTDLYGISYLDIDTLQVYNYIPEGQQHDHRRSQGESFIITDVHYDKSTDLVAYGGCYWAGPSDVYIGRLSDPMSFDPKLTNLRGFADPGYEEGCELDFVRWESGSIIIKDADEGKEYSIPLDKIEGI